MAADNIGTAYVQIVPAATGITNKMTTAISPGAQAAGVAAGKQITSNIGSQMQKVGGGMIKAGAIATAVSVPIIAGIKKAMDAYQIQNAAETKLTEIYKTRMGVSDKAAKKTMEYASALQAVGVVGDEVQLSGAQQLATFAKTPATVNKLLPAMNNLLVQQKGLNGTEQDATNIANLMGKVLQGQTGALKRVGVSFDETQEKILKTGTEEERAAMLAEVITENVGNMNETMAATPEGKIQQLKNTMGDMVEELGKALAPTLADIAKWVSAKIMPAVSKFMKMLQGNPIIAKIVVGITGLLAVGGPLLIILGTIVSSVGALMPMLTAITAPMIAIGAAIAAVVAALIYAWKTNEQFRAAITNMVTQVSAAAKKLLAAVMPTIRSIIKIIAQLVTNIASSLVPVINAATPLITKAVNLVAAVFKKAGPIVVKILETIAKVVASVIGKSAKIFTAFVVTVDRVWDRVTSTIGKAVNWIKTHINFGSVVTKVKNTFSRVAEFISSPFNKAKGLVDKAVGAIKKIFPIKLSKIFSGVKLPHFKISGGKIPWGIGGQGKKPSVDIDWYAKGGIFDSPSVIGVGEASREAAIPLQGRYMRPFAQAIASEMAGAGNTYNIGDITLDVKDLKDIVTLEQFITLVKRAKGLSGARP